MFESLVNGALEAEMTLVAGSVALVVVAGVIAIVRRWAGPSRVDGFDLGGRVQGDDTSSTRS